MAGGAGMTGAGLGIMGGILGGIGDIYQAHNYKRPFWPAPTPEQLRLRDLASQQLQAGGMEYAGGMNLLNQVTPLMMGLVPGMHVNQPNQAPGGAAPDTAGAPGMTNVPVPGMSDYQSALGAYQNQIGAQQSINRLKGQLKTTPKGPQRQAVRQQLRAAQKTIRSSPTMSQSEQNVYQAASMPPAMTVTRGGGTDTSGPTQSDQTAAGSGGATGVSGGAGFSMDPSTQTSLASILGYLHGASGLTPAAAPSAAATPTGT